MKRLIVTIEILAFNIIPIFAYDRHGRDYSVNGGGSSTMFLIVGVIILFLFLWFNNGNKEKK